MRKAVTCTTLFILALFISASIKAESTDSLIDIDDISVHDPQILADPISKTYYLYGQYSPNREFELIQPPCKNGGVQVYCSKDLKKWTRPKLVFEIPDNFWSEKKDAPWAPEVHLYKGKYYLFVTFNDWEKIIDVREGRPKITHRASQILVADSPMGPFKPFNNFEHTPKGEMTLDATFWVENRQPYMVYCHEWIQMNQGTIEAIKLSRKLSKTVGKPFKLICSGEVDWPNKEINYKDVKYPGIVTDGPYFYKTKLGTLIMIWSSWGKKEYAQAIAYSESGKLKGPWKHVVPPILENDRGHGMIFKDFDGRLLLCLHRYFHQPATRVQIWELKDTGKMIEVGNQLYGAK